MLTDAQNNFSYKHWLLESGERCMLAALEMDVTSGET